MALITRSSYSSSIQCEEAFPLNGSALMQPRHDGLSGKATGRAAPEEGGVVIRLARQGSN